MPPRANSGRCFWPTFLQRPWLIACMGGGLLGTGLLQLHEAPGDGNFGPYEQPAPRAAVYSAAPDSSRVAPDATGDADITSTALSREDDPTVAPAPASPTSRLLETELP